MEKLQIENMSDVRCFIYFMVIEKGLGAGFHPDTPIDDYVNETGMTTFTFTIYEATLLQHQLDRCFAVCERLGEDIYEQGVQPLAYLGMLECQQADRDITTK